MIPGLPVPGFGTVFRVATVVVGVVAAIPTRTRDLSSRPNAAPTYAAAVMRASAQQAFDDSVAVPQGRSILLTHGHPRAARRRAVSRIHRLASPVR